MLDTLKEHLCSNCKGQCKGIIIEEREGLKYVKCIGYEKKEKVQGYKKIEEVTAKKHRALMRLNI